jgi:hypothetical protein
MTNAALILTNQAAASVLEANDIRDIRGPLDIFNPLVLILLAWFVLFIVTLILAGWRNWKNRLKKSAPVPMIPAHVRARQKLQKALGIIMEPKPFCITVSDTLRSYLEERFNFRAPERTTEEFLYELRGTNMLTPDQKESLGDFLQSCDLVKFARYEPGETELMELHKSALRLVDETEPVVLPPGIRAQPPPLPVMTNKS